MKPNTQQIQCKKNEIIKINPKIPANYVSQQKFMTRII